MDLGYRELEHLSQAVIILQTGKSNSCPKFLQLKMLLLQQHIFERPRAAFKVTKAIIKANPRVVTKFSTKGTKVVIKGGTKAREKDTRVVVNRITMARRVMVANLLQIMVEIFLPNVNLPKNIHLT